MIVGTGLGLLLLLRFMNFSATDNTASCVTKNFFVKIFAHMHLLDVVLNSLFVFLANLMQQWTLQRLLRTKFQIGTLNWIFLFR